MIITFKFKNEVGQWDEWYSAELESVHNKDGIWTVTDAFGSYVIPKNYIFVSIT